MMGTIEYYYALSIDDQLTQIIEWCDLFDLKKSKSCPSYEFYTCCYITQHMLY